jgi:hypothetical protein
MPEIQRAHWVFRPADNTGADNVHSPIKPAINNQRGFNAKHLFMLVPVFNHTYKKTVHQHVL